MRVPQLPGLRRQWLILGRLQEQESPIRIFFGWYIVAASVCLMPLASGLTLYGFPLFFDAILADYPWSKALAAFAFGAMQFESGALAPLWGWIIDRFGTRGPMLAATASLVAGYLILSQLDSLLAFYVGYGLTGLGFGCYAVAPFASISNWFRARRTLAIGIALSGNGLAGFLAPVLNWGIQAYGWRSVYIAAALLTLAVGVPLSLVLRHRPDPYGYNVDGSPDPAQNDHGTEPAGPLFSAGEALRTRAFWIIAALVILYWMAFAGMLPHMVTYLKGVGIGPDDAALGITGVTVVTIIGRIGGGALADRYGKRPILLGALLLLSVGVLVFASISETWQLVLFVAVYAPAFGAISASVPALIGDFFGTRSFALIFGLATLPATLLLFGVASAVGWVFDTYGVYQPAWFVLAFMTLVAVPLVGWLQPPSAHTPERAPG